VSECLVEIRDQVLGMLKADGEADETRRDAGFGRLVLANGTPPHGARLCGQRFETTEADSALGQLHVVQERLCRSKAALHLKAHEPAKAAGHLPLGERVRGVKLDFIRPGKPTENAFVESFNGSLCDECLNVNEFATIEEVRTELETWRQDYNHHRPHGSLGQLTPIEFAAHDQKQRPGATKL